MKKILLTLLILSFCTTYSQNQTATTKDGKKVILYSNGSWKYDNQSKFELPYGWKKVSSKKYGCGKTEIIIDLNKDGIDDHVMIAENNDGTKSALVLFISINNKYVRRSINNYANEALDYNQQSRVLSNYGCESGGLYYKWNGRSFSEFNPY